MPASGNPLVELDVATAAGFIASTRAAIDGAGDPSFFLDCGAITFMDSAAFYAIRDVTRYARAAGHPLIVGNLLPMPGWVLSFCDWDRELSIAAA